jgi:hypothetical protein
VLDRYVPRIGPLELGASFLLVALGFGQSYYSSDEHSRSSRSSAEGWAWCTKAEDLVAFGLVRFVV